MPLAMLWARVDAGVGRQRDAVGKPCIAGGDDDGDVGNARIGGKAVERVLQHGDAEQGGVLFGGGGAIAAADACGGDKGDVGHGNLSGWVCGFQAALMRTALGVNTGAVIQQRQPENCIVTFSGCLLLC